MSSERVALALHDRPMAASPLKSYRYRGNYGWIMIGAKDDADALREAQRSLSSGHGSRTSAALPDREGSC
jgi:hypothetical protein